MTVRFSAETLDLSRYEPPLAIRGVDFEKALVERYVRLATTLASLGIPFDAMSLEADPAVALQQADNYREILAYAAINDAVRGGLIAFAVGPDLEHLAAFYGVSRRVITPVTNGVPAVLESDAELRRRVLLAPEAFSTAGTHGGYVFHALTSDPRVLNADVWSTAPGEVSVAVQSRTGDGTASADLLAAVRAHLARHDIKPLTDVVNVRSVVNVPYRIEVEGFVLPGPDPLSIRTAMVESLAAMAASRRTPSRDVPRSAVFAAASIGPLDKAIVASPNADIAMGFGEVAVPTAVDVTVTTYAG